MGCQSFHSKDYHSALTTFSKVGNYSKILFNIGLIYTLNNDYSSSELMFGKSVEQDEYFAAGYFMLGYSLFKLENQKDSLDCYEYCLGLLHDNNSINYTQLGLEFILYKSMVLYNMSICYQVLGKENKSDRYYSNSLDKSTSKKVDKFIEKNRGTLNLFKCNKIFELPKSKADNLKLRSYLEQGTIMGEVRAGFSGADILDGENASSTLRRPSQKNDGETRRERQEKKVKVSGFRSKSRSRKKEKPPLSDNDGSDLDDFGDNDFYDDDDNYFKTMKSNASSGSKSSHERKWNENDSGYRSKSRPRKNGRSPLLSQVFKDSDSSDSDGFGSGIKSKTMKSTTPSERKRPQNDNGYRSKSRPRKKDRSPLLSKKVEDQGESSDKDSFGPGKYSDDYRNIPSSPAKSAGERHLQSLKENTLTKRSKSTPKIEYAQYSSNNMNNSKGKTKTVKVHAYRNTLTLQVSPDIQLSKMKQLVCNKLDLDDALLMFIDVEVGEDMVEIEDDEDMQLAMEMEKCHLYLGDN